MTISHIKTMLPVPEITFENTFGDWRYLFQEYGTPFPDAYVEFVSSYGTGSIGDFLWVLNPFSKNSNLNSNQIKYLQDAYQTLKEDFPEYYPRNREDFIPWAVTDNGDSLIWLITPNNPNEWKVSIQAGDPTQEEATNLTTLEFLEALVNNELNSSILPIDFLDAKKEFTACK
jgi:hypothetical protein